jgi:hypothetical protein
MPDTQTHIHGYDKHITWKADTGASEGTVHILGADIDDAVDLNEVTNTGTQGEQAFLAGIKRASKTIDITLYKEISPATISLTPGTKGTIKSKWGLSSDWDLHVIVERIAWKKVVNGAITIRCDVKSDAIKADGTITTSITRAS